MFDRKVDYEVFAGEYEKTHRILGGSIAAETLDVYYDTICLVFDEQDLVESFAEARSTLDHGRFPAPVKLKELRDVVRKRRPQLALPESAIVAVPCPDDIRRKLAELLKLRSASSCMRAISSRDGASNLITT